MENLSICSCASLIRSREIWLSANGSKNIKIQPLKAFPILYSGWFHDYYPSTIAFHLNLNFAVAGLGKQKNREMIYKREKSECLSRIRSENMRKFSPNTIMRQTNDNNKNTDPSLTKKDKHSDIEDHSIFIRTDIV